MLRYAIIANVCCVCSGRRAFFIASSCLIQFMRSMRVVFVLEFWVATKVLHDGGNAPNKRIICNFDSFWTLDVRQPSNLCFHKFMLNN